MDKEKQREYMREYQRKRRQNPAVKEAEYAKHAEYMKTVYAEKQRIRAREAYRAKIGTPYDKRHTKSCERCGTVFNCVRVTTKYCQYCRGKTK